MSEKKVLQKEKVLTCGRGDRRAVLCFDSGLVYQYDDPSNITAQYAPKLNAWVKLKRPYYNAGGWGRSSSGPVDEAYLIYNTESLLSSIDAAVYELNQESWLTNTDIIQYNKRAKEQNKDIQRMAMAKKYKHSVNEFPVLKPIELSEKMNSGSGGKGTDVFTAIKEMENAVNVFISGKGPQTNVATYRINSKIVIQGNTTVAYRAKNGDIVMNSQVLSLTGFERAFLSGESIIQNTIKSKAKVSIPFNVLESAGLKLNETKIIEQGPEETFQIKKVNHYSNDTETRHFTGYLILENAGRKFFMDIDRIEIKHGIFNVFFVEIDSKVKNYNEAYNSMKPDIVKTAENQGLKVLRQGEWFFIPTGEKAQVLERNIHSRLLRAEENNNLKDIMTLQHFHVSHGKGRPNGLFRPVFNGQVINDTVCGIVTHSGREHRPLNLGYLNLENENHKPEIFEKGYSYHNTSTDRIEVDLYKIVGNTTVSNFTITGDVD